MTLTKALKDHYWSNYNRARVLGEWQAYVNLAIERIKRSKADYEKVAQATGTPWYVIAVIHGMESNFDFRTHLHNGDPLSARTVQVPAGRPVLGMPPFSWLESAIDAIMHETSGHSDWSLEGTLYFLECYNGTGYLDYHPRNMSQYLWSATSVQTRGKYVADGKWDEDAVSAQVGCVAMLKTLEKEGLINMSAKDSVPSAPTWFDFQKGKDGVIYVTGYAVDRPITQLQTKSSHAIANWLLSFKNHSVMIAPPEKPIPNLNQQTKKSIDQTLLEYATNKENYVKVGNEVLEFYPDGTWNGCAAYCSEFLRNIGINVPIKLNADGLNISLVAQSLAEWLLENGWKKSKVGVAGMIAVTDAAKSDPGYAAHIWILATDVDSDGYAICVDNQGFKYNRNATVYGQKTKVDYFLTAP
jgi:lysozyme family protein